MLCRKKKRGIAGSKAGEATKGERSKGSFTVHYSSPIRIPRMTGVPGTDVALTLASDFSTFLPPVCVRACVRACGSVCERAYVPARAHTRACVRTCMCVSWTLWPHGPSHRRALTTTSPHWAQTSTSHTMHGNDMPHTVNISASQGNGSRLSGHTPRPRSSLRHI